VLTLRFSPSSGFLDVGNITFEVNGVIQNSFKYKYDNRRNNLNLISLQKLSSNAGETMKGLDGAYYKEFNVFVDYYGDTNYGDKWVSAAFNKVNTGFSSK
jgi:hypothetical protein